MSRRTWCVQHRDGWCIRKDRSKAARIADDFTAVETLCDHWITLPMGAGYRRPTCAECKKIEADVTPWQPPAEETVQGREGGHD